MKRKKKIHKTRKSDYFRKHNYDFRRSVCGKVCYPSQHIAKITLKSFMTSGLKEYKTETLSIYYCKTCDAYHLGNKQGAQYDSKTNRKEI